MSYFKNKTIEYLQVNVLMYGSYTQNTHRSFFHWYLISLNSLWANEDNNLFLWK